MALGDNIGEKYNELTIMDEFRKNNRIYCIAKCSCGESIETRKDSVTSGGTKSCGCKRKEDITGKRFTRLVAVKPIGRSKNGTVIWECKCNCGNVTKATLVDLKDRNVQSCGCLRSEVSSKNVRIAHKVFLKKYQEDK